MASSPQDRAAIQSWLNANERFLHQEGGGLTTLAVLDLLDAGHQAAAPIAVTWIEGRLSTILGQRGDEGSLEPWKILLAGSASGVWNLYLHNVPTNLAFLDEFPPKSRTAFFNRANFIRLAESMVALAGDPEYRQWFRAALVASLAGEVYPTQFLAKPEPSTAREPRSESMYHTEPETGPSIWAITPGGSLAPLWHDWLEEGNLCVGSEESDWDRIPDLRSFPDKDAFYAHYREEVWNDKRDALWTIRSLKPGDIILANQGRTQILGVGIVQSPGYIFRSDRTHQRHSVRVRWDSSCPKILEKPGPRWLYTVHLVSKEEYEVWYGPLQSPLQTGPAQPVLEAQEELAEAQGAFDPTSIEDARERVMGNIVRRRGQQAFREALIQRYEGRCVVTGCNVVEVLEAAHIIPYQGKSTNHPENGLLLRADIHTLFDLGLLAIGEDMRVILHSTLRASSHWELHGRQLLLPANATQFPSFTAIAAHREWAGLNNICPATQVWESDR